MQFDWLRDKIDCCLIKKPGIHATPYMIQLSPNFRKPKSKLFLVLNLGERAFLAKRILSRTFVEAMYAVH
jgi:hypothetical protein